MHKPLLLALLALPATARAHDPALHVGTAHDSCYFDLHGELTTSQFKEFAGEAGQVVRFRQTSAARPLGRGQLDVGLGYGTFFIDDSKGAWNNTMSHPTAEHELGDQLAIPTLNVRLGVTDGLDAEVFGSVNWLSNYGLVGTAWKLRLMDEASWPVSLTVRPSLSALVGPSELGLLNAAADLAVSRSWGGLSPFAGATLSATMAFDRSDDTQVGDQGAMRALAFVGLEYRWKALDAAVQAEVGDLVAVALHLGGTF